MFRILIADDDAGFRQALGELLQTHFPKTELRAASDGQQTLQLLDSVDLLLLDISLPQESGLELTAKIKSEHPELVVSILTIHDLPEYRQAALQHGADYFVSKGAPAEQILQVVQSAIAGRQAHGNPRRSLSGC
ncbi:MAG: response regulator [Gammaproteobacteria bacterium]|nr:response regulator [Gammaproteobacteria bacterium]